VAWAGSRLVAGRRPRVARWSRRRPRWWPAQPEGEREGGKRGFALVMMVIVLVEEMLKEMKELGIEMGKLEEVGGGCGWLRW